MNIIEKIAVAFLSGKVIRKLFPFLCFQRILDYMPDAFIIIDRRGIVTDVNKACCDLLGYTKKEIIGQSASMFFVRKTNENGVCLYPTKNDDEVYLGRILDELVLNGYVNDLEVVFVTKDCRRIPMLFNAVVMRDLRGEITGVLGLARDISRITRYTEKLQLIRDLTFISFKDTGLKEVLGQLFVPVQKFFRIERAAVYLNKGDYLESIFISGYSGPPVVVNQGKGITGYVARTLRTYYTNNVDTDPYFDRIIDEKTGCKTINMLARPLITDEGGSPSCVGVVEVFNKRDGFTDEDVKDFEEITELMRAVLTVQWQREELKKDIAAIKLISDISGKAAEPLLVSGFMPYLCETLGRYLNLRGVFVHLPTDKSGKFLECKYTWTLPSQEGEMNAWIIPIPREEEDTSCDFIRRLRSGGMVYLHREDNPCKNISSDIYCYSIKEKEEALLCGVPKSARTRLINGLPLLMVPLFVKKEFSGFVVLAGCPEFYKMEQAERLRQISIIRSVSVLVSLVLEREKDVIEKENLMAQSADQARMASVGELAAGLAHEIGNPLQTILGNAELLKMSYPGNEELKAIIEAARQARATIENLLDFTRSKKDNDISVTDINEVIDKTLSLFGKQLKLSNIKVVKNFDRNLPAVLVSAPQISQVFMNIITNARHAMEEYANGGTLTISTYVKRLRKEQLAGGGIAGIIPDENNVASSEADVMTYVVAEFKDTGKGIKQELIPRMVEPFFTTRKGGTGLGLSVSYGIIKRYGGKLLIHSEGEGKGLEIRILLPTSQRETPEK